MNIRNEHYEEMSNKVGSILSRLIGDYRHEGGSFCAADEVNPAFFGTLIVNQTQPKLMYMEKLSEPVPFKKQREVVFALNAINSCTMFNKFYLKDFPTADGWEDYFVVEENSLFCPGGKVTDTDVLFLLASGMQDLAMYAAGIRGVVTGNVSAAEFINSITREF